MNKQPEALRLASVIDSWKPGVEAAAVATELRRQHALIAELVEALRSAAPVAQQAAPDAALISPRDDYEAGDSFAGMDAALSKAEAQQ